MQCQALALGLKYPYVHCASHFIKLNSGRSKHNMMMKQLILKRIEPGGAPHSLALSTSSLRRPLQRPLRAPNFSPHPISSEYSSPYSPRFTSLRASFVQPIHQLRFTTLPFLTPGSATLLRLSARIVRVFSHWHCEHNGLHHIF